MLSIAWWEGELQTTMRNYVSETFVIELALNRHRDHLTTSLVFVEMNTFISFFGSRMLHELG